MSLEKTPIIALLPERDSDSLPVAAGLLTLESPDERAVGRLFPLVDRISVGRVEEGDVNFAVNDNVLSRRHFLISKNKNRSGALQLVDHGSTNGTFVEGRRTARVELELGSIIRAGETIFAFDEFPVPLPKPIASDTILWQSIEMATVMAAITRVAPTILPVLIEGPTGTGKELLARSVHERSGRRGPFVAVNCAAIPNELTESYFFGHKKGAFTGATQDSTGHWLSANDGTLFLDEIGELPLVLQAKILRALDSGEVTPVGANSSVRSNARIVAATNVDLSARVESNQFRRDLYARLAIYLIASPALRDRRCDIPLLLRHFLSQAAPHKTWKINANFMQHLLLHTWPMNIRELRTLAQRLAVDTKSDVLKETLLPEAMRVMPPVVEAPGQPELAALLAQHQGNVAAIARALNKERRQVYRWLKRHGLSVDNFRSADAHDV